MTYADDTPTDLADLADKTPVLVVEDDPAYGQALTHLLDLAGYRTVLCETGADALAYARGHATPATARPAALILDVHLPDVEGPELSRGLRAALGQAVPVIFLSGDTSIDALRTLPPAAATQFFAKTTRCAVLLDRLAHAVAPQGT